MIDLSLEAPSTLAVVDEIASELRALAAQFRDHDYSNYDCAEVLKEWIDKTAGPQRSERKSDD